MKKFGCALLVLILGIVMLVVVILSNTGDDECVSPGGTSSSPGQDANVPEGAFVVPEENGLSKVTSGFGPRGGAMHQGLDIASGQGTALYAFADGVVAQAGPASGFGQWIVIDHTIDGEAVSTVYGHLFPDDLLVKTGDKVSAGQHIGNEGYNGGVDPPGPQGSHLHFEVWPGTRLGGGSPVDPQPWLEKAVDPGSGGAAPESGNDRAPDSTKDTPATGVEELKPDPRFNETNMQVDAVRVGRAAARNFPEVEIIGGWRADGGYASDHTEGRAVDVMIPDFSSAEGKELGDRVRAYFLANATDLNLDYMIWRQYLTYPDGTGYLMDDRQNLTQNHFDHVHISTETSELATPGQNVGAGTIGGSASGASSGSSACPESSHAMVDGELGHTEGIPAELQPWIIKAGGLCAEAPAPLIAGLMEQESQFKPGAVSKSGARGYGQFMPETWAGIGAEVDDNGEVIGPPGSGDPRDPADASMATGRYLCSIAEMQKPQIASGEISGDPTELMLAGYNAGPGAVAQAGGVPMYAETRQYVKIIPQNAAKYQ